MSLWTLLAFTDVDCLITDATFLSPRAHLDVVGMFTVYGLDINQPSMPTPFYSVLVPVSVFMALSAVFHCINSPDNSPLSHSVLLVLFCLIGPLNYISLYECLPQP